MRCIFPLLLASTALLASPTLDQRINTLEDQMTDLHMRSVYGNVGANTARGTPFLTSWGAYFEAEAIYWKFFEGGTDYAYAGPPASGDDLYTTKKLKTLDFDWQFAYRFTLGYQFKKPDWDIWSTFTRFTTQESTSVQASSEAGTFKILPTQDVPSHADYTRASEKWKLFYNVLDVNLGRSYFLRKTFSAHPFFGVRGALINQRNGLTWAGSASSDFNYKSTNNFSGVGILGGTQGRWHFNSHWSFFGSVLGSLLYGWYDIDTTIQQFYPTQLKILSLSSDLRRLVPNMATDIGFTWEYAALKERLLFSLSLAYEFQYWWAQNQTLHTKAGIDYTWDRWAEDFGLQGLKLNFGLDY